MEPCRRKRYRWRGRGLRILGGGGSLGNEESLAEGRHDFSTYLPTELLYERKYRRREGGLGKNIGGGGKLGVEQIFAENCENFSPYLPIYLTSTQLQP